MSTLSSDLLDAIDGATESTGRDSQISEWADRARKLERALESLANGWKYPSEVCQIARNALDGQVYSTEEYYATMEGSRAAAEDAYFEARPVAGTLRSNRDHFRAGFERAFQLLWSGPSSPRVGRSSLQPGVYMDKGTEDL